MAIRPEEVLRVEDLAVQDDKREEENVQREEALRGELMGVRNLNQVMEGVIATLSTAKDNMDVSPSIPASLICRPLARRLKTRINY
jgi:hypothetical protein